MFTNTPPPHMLESSLKASKKAVVLVVRVDVPLVTLLLDAVIQRHPNVYRAVHNRLPPSVATLDRIDQSSDTSHEWCTCTTLHIVGRVVGHLNNIVPSIVTHVGLERPDALSSFLPQWPVKDHVGLGLCRDIAQLLASEFGPLVGLVSLDDLRDASVGRIGIAATINESLQRGCSG